MIVIQLKNGMKGIGKHINCCTYLFFVSYKSPKEYFYSSISKAR
ncbi:hypothetical protein OKW24_003349 [Peribacillus simplex]|nr:hypothetical protein [Peribacillus simplex]